MKILEVSKLYSPWLGGVEKIAQQIAEGLNTQMDADKDADKADKSSVENADIDADKEELLYGDLTYQIRGAIFNVYNGLGPGHKEKIYQKALEEEFRKCDLSFEEEKEISISYGEKSVGTYRPDFIVEGKIIIEIKALLSLGKLEKKQVWSYLKGSDYHLALLVNFGAPELQIKRVIYDLARYDDQRKSAHMNISVNPRGNQRESAHMNISVNPRGNQRESAHIEVLCCNSRGRSKNDKVNEVKVKRANSLGVVWGMPLSFNFLNFFRKEVKKFDVVDFHHPFPLGDLAILFFNPKKLIVHYHSDIVRQKILSFLFKPLVLHTLSKADKIVVSSPNLIKSSPYLSRFKDKCEVIPFGVNPSKFRERINENKIEKIREKYNKFVLFAGRLNYYKGTRYLIEAMKDINANLVIIGEGEQRNTLEKMTAKSEIKKKVHFLPFQNKEKLINFYKAAEVFILPSTHRSEAFGIVLIEAMSCGTPIISTELGTGTSWVNQDGETGFVVPPKNSEALAEAISKIFGNEKMAHKMSQNAKKRVEEKFTEERMLEKTYQLYKNLA